MSLSLIYLLMYLHLSSSLSCLNSSSSVCAFPGSFCYRFISLESELVWTDCDHESHFCKSPGCHTGHINVNATSVRGRFCCCNEDLCNSQLCPCSQPTTKSRLQHKTICIESNKTIGFHCEIEEGFCYHFTTDNTSVYESGCDLGGKFCNATECYTGEHDVGGAQYVGRFCCCSENFCNGEMCEQMYCATTTTQATTTSSTTSTAPNHKTTTTGKTSTSSTTSTSPSTSTQATSTNSPSSRPTPTHSSTSTDPKSQTTTSKQGGKDNKKHPLPPILIGVLSGALVLILVFVAVGYGIYRYKLYKGNKAKGRHHLRSVDLPGA